MSKPTPEETPNFFEQLKEIRISKGFTLEEISNETKIQLRYLEAIESGQLERIPDIYDKLFFKTYLDFIDPPDYKTYWDEFLGLRLQHIPQHTTTIRRIKSLKVEQSKRKLLKWLFLAVPLLIVIVIIITLAMNSENVDSMPNNENVPELSVKQIVREMQPKQVEPIPIKIDSVQVQVALKAVSRTWFRMIKDYSDTVEYLLKKDEKISFKADSVLLFLVGNAAGLNFEINGKSVGILGQPNEVITGMKVTKEGIIAKRLKQIKQKEVQNDSLEIH